MVVRTVRVMMMADAEVQERVNADAAAAATPAQRRRGRSVPQGRATIPPILLLQPVLLTLHHVRSVDVSRRPYCSAQLLC